MQDLVKWSLKDENRALQDALTQVGELFSVWTEVQRDLSTHIKEFQHQFDMILEGAKQLDMAKADLQTAEIKEGKLKKELKKAAKKATTEELREMSVKLSEAEREKDLAQLEVVDRVREHEAVKMIRIKEGIFKISEAYIDYAQKCDVIFGAQRDIALQIPDVHDKDIQDIKYTGAGSTQQAVARAKDKIKRFRRRNSSVAHASRESPPHCTVPPSPHPDLPPPYSENPPVNPFYNDIPRNISTSELTLGLELPPGGPESPSRLSPSLYGRAMPHHPSYPLLPNIPPYSQQMNPLGGQCLLPAEPPAFHSVAGEHPSVGVRGRRDSYFSDTEEGLEGGPPHLSVNIRNLNLGNH